MRLACGLAALLLCGVLQAAATPPRLVVLLVVDGLPQRQVERLRGQFAPDGLARFLREGTVYREAHHGHAHTVTAAGHAAIATGAYPEHSGIIANAWRDPVDGERIYCTADGDAHYLEHPTQAGDGTSPRWLEAETLGDALRRAQPQARVLAVAGKDRAAILSAGRSGTPYMYMAGTGRFATSSFYRSAHPPWVTRFHAGRPADRWLGASWEPLRPDAAYAGALPDATPWIAAAGGRLPMRLPGSGEGAPRGTYHSALPATPFGDLLTLEFALAAVHGEALGRDAVPDLLVVGLSGQDLVNHRYSAESRLSHDHLLHLDRAVQSFFQALDATVGREHYVAVLTADHGFMPAPEHLQAQGRPAGRSTSRELLERVNAALEQRWRAPRLARFLSASTVVLDREAIARRGLDFDAVARTARRALLDQPAVAAAYTRAELLAGSRADAPHFTAIRRSWHATRSGDVAFVLAPNWMLGTAVATHGSPHRYDTHVPLALWGPRWIGPRQVARRVEVVDLAPTLARLLGSPVPAQSVGRLLPGLAFTRQQQN